MATAGSGVPAWVASSSRRDQMVRAAVVDSCWPTTTRARYSASDSLRRGGGPSGPTSSMAAAKRREIRRAVRTNSAWAVALSIGEGLWIAEILTASRTSRLNPRGRRVSTLSRMCGTQPICGGRHGLAAQSTAGEPHRGDLYPRTPEHGMGAAVPGLPGPRNQIPHGGDRPQGRPAGAGEQADHRDRAADRHDRLDRRPLDRGDQGRADGRHREFQLRRPVRRRAQDGRLRSGDPRRPLAETRLSLHRGRARRTAGRLASVGPLGVGNRTGDQGFPRGPADPRRVHRPVRRIWLPLRLHRQRPASGRRPLRRRHRDGLQAPEGHCGPRHPRGAPARREEIHGGRAGCNRRVGHQQGSQ